VTLLVAWLLWRSLIKLYSRAQAALQETLSRPGPVPAPFKPEGLLHDANLEMVVIPPDSSAAGKLIRELQLRTGTGASIIGIERNGSNLVNPGPDEELQANDKVLLLGTRSQLKAAREALASA